MRTGSPERRLENAVFAVHCGHGGVLQWEDDKEGEGEKDLRVIVAVCNYIVPGRRAAHPLVGDRQLLLDHGIQRYLLHVP